MTVYDIGAVQLPDAFTFHPRVLREVRELPTNEAVPSVKVEARLSNNDVSEPLWNDAVASVIVPDITEPLNDAAFAPVSEPPFNVAVPSVMVKPVIEPAHDIWPAVMDPLVDIPPPVNTADPSDRVNAVTDDELDTAPPLLIDPLVDKWPLFNTAVPSVTVDPVTDEELKITLPLVTDPLIDSWPPFNTAVPSVRVSPDSCPVTENDFSPVSNPPCKTAVPSVSVAPITLASVDTLPLVNEPLVDRLPL